MKEESSSYPEGSKLCRLAMAQGKTDQYRILPRKQPGFDGESRTGSGIHVFNDLSKINGYQSSCQHTSFCTKYLVKLSNCCQ